MKRMLCFALCMLLFFCGCSPAEKHPEDSVAFYYPRTDFFSGKDDQVLAPEYRAIHSATEKLSSVLSIYLAGPHSEELQAPFPVSVTLISAVQEGNSIHLILSEIPESTSEAAFALGCACLTMTCLNLIEAESVTITSGDHTITLSRSELTLFDSNTPVTTEEPQ